jgi:hypothetical protein
MERVVTLWQLFRAPEEHGLDELSLRVQGYATELCNSGEGNLPLATSPSKVFFATVICNVPGPLFTGIRPTMQVHCNAHIGSQPG